ncbi:alpha/beta fold hydrolase [Halorarius halobius]|uniref:alpha/beta fold hydrolase n=1 Tax=Halorarius halobius TaxID=2962671 RepID=UPI0020CED666|nr:alpha/beta hydrolase [Halorarius halobius]
MEVDANGLTFECRTWGEGEPLLCLHGFPDDPTTFEALAAELDGYELVAPYMRGYGPTDAAPDGRYDAAALGADAAALAEQLDARYVVGHDWGAVAVYAALAGDHSFERAATMAVPPRFDALLFRHPKQVLRSWYVWLFQFPGVAERALTGREFLLVELLWGLWSPGWDWPDERLAAVKETFEAGDTADHALSYYRDMVNGSMTGLARRGLPDVEPDEPFETPTLVLAGERDGCIGPDLFERAGDCFERARVVEVSDAGHFMHCERPGVVAGELERWLG